MSNHHTALALTLEAVVIPTSLTIGYVYIRNALNGTWERLSREQEERRRTCAPPRKDTPSSVSPRR